MDPDPGGPKTCGCSGSGSAALIKITVWDHISENLKIFFLKLFDTIRDQGWIREKHCGSAILIKIIICFRIYQQPHDFFYLKCSIPDPVPFGSLDPVPFLP